MEHGWWGEAPWGGPCSTMEQVDAPVGAECASCEEAVADGERGVTLMVWRPGTDAHEVALHAECFLRLAAGHDRGYCECVRPAWLTPREHARAFWRAFHASLN